MLKPSIDDLLEEINSKFALTIVISKRARQLQLTPDDFKVEEPVGPANNEVAKSLEELNADTLEYYLDCEEMQQAQELAIVEALEAEEIIEEELTIE